MAMGYEFAPKRTAVAASQTDSQIESGRSIYVHGIVCSNSSGGGTVILEDASGNAIHTIQIPASTTVELRTKWLADGGLQLTTAANTTAVVFHSQGGA
jgi:hypothetical protein